MSLEIIVLIIFAFIAVGVAIYSLAKAPVTIDDIELSPEEKTREILRKVKQIEAPLMNEVGGFWKPRPDLTVMLVFEPTKIPVVERETEF